MEGSQTSFNFDNMIQGMGRYVDKVKDSLNQLQAATGGQVDLGQMFKMQFNMQMMSQYVEATSNTLSAVHNEMMSMARAVKGQ